MDVFEGRITSTGFSSGDRIVIGDWKESPLGNFTNIMWAKHDGTRVLLSPSKKHADYVSELYSFEEVRITGIDVLRSKGGISVKGGGLSVRISWGNSFPLPFWRPLWFVASVEAVLGRAIFGTKTYGRTRNDRREWYSVRSISRVLEAEGDVDGKKFGQKESFQTTACFGFSEPPSMPASVTLKSYIQ